MSHLVLIPFNRDQTNYIIKKITSCGHQESITNTISHSGTQTGDATEMSSVLETFAPSPSQSRRSRSSDQPLFLGSAKSNIGHGEAVSGASSVIKILQMMKKRTIVPHCGIKTKINHKFPVDLVDRQVHIASNPQVWVKDDSKGPRRVFVNNFSAAGGNTALLLEEAPRITENVNTNEDSRNQYPIAISAKNGVSLQGNMRSILHYMRSNPEISLGQLSYTTTARRAHHQHRLLFNGSNIKDISANIEIALSGNAGMSRPKRAPDVVFTFTGQGAQYPGMGKQLYEESSVVRAELDRSNQIAKSLGFPSILPVILSNELDISKFEPSTVQLASVCLQLALSKWWASLGIHPTAVVGHSLGEYAALNLAGVLSDTDTIFLVGERARLLERTCIRGTHVMLVVKGSQDEIKTLLKGHQYEVVCVNSPTETVLAGNTAQIATVKDLLTLGEMRSTLLAVPYAFHSSQLDPILSEFRKIAAGATFFKPKIPVLCPLNGTIVTEGDVFGPDYLVSHSRKPVNMWSALSAASHDGLITSHSIMLEIGPHPAVSGMVKAVLGQQSLSIPSLQRLKQPWDVLASSLKILYENGAQINWAAYQRDFQRSHVVIPLPAYSWDLKDYWIQYVNDWSLRKGDPPLTLSQAPSLESTTIHSIIKESRDSTKCSIVVQSDIAREDLRPLVQGHEVDGIPLCTPSVYADMALSLGRHLLEGYQSSKDRAVVISDMTISKALILQTDAAKQLIQAHVEADWSSKSATAKFMSFNVRPLSDSWSKQLVLKSYRTKAASKSTQDVSFDSTT